MQLYMTVLSTPREQLTRTRTDAIGVGRYAVRDTEMAVDGISQRTTTRKHNSQAVACAELPKRNKDGTVSQNNSWGRGGYLPDTNTAVHAASPPRAAVCHEYYTLHRDGLAEAGKGTFPHASLASVSSTSHPTPFSYQARSSSLQGVWGVAKQGQQDKTTQRPSDNSARSKLLSTGPQTTGATAV
ncbi:unnamed protein product [Ectocarpus sp. 12 AP-2014]